MGPPPLPHQIEVLGAILDRIAMGEATQRAPAVAFGVDGVLCDNRFRTVQVLAEYADRVRGTEPEVAEGLDDIGVHDVRYLLSDTLRGLGLTAADVVRAITHFWQDRFYSDEYCDSDEPMLGAVEYVRACHEAGARVVYLSTRDAPGMLLGTIKSLRDLGFPIAVPGVEVVLKPDGTMSDEAFKRGFIPALARCGELVAFFDNAPTSCNLALERFPDADIVLLESFPVPGPPEPDRGVHLVADLRMG